jgi:hypothetical protein
MQPRFLDSILTMKLIAFLVVLLFAGVIQISAQQTQSSPDPTDP